MCVCVCVCVGMVCLGVSVCMFYACLYVSAAGSSSLAFTLVDVFTNTSSSQMYSLCSYGFVAGCNHFLL